MPENNEIIDSPFVKSEIDTAMDSFIKEAAVEFAPPDDFAPVPETPSADPASPAAYLAPTPEATKAPEGEDAAVTRGLERLVAREVELRTREDRLKGSESEVEALRARVRELEPLALSPDLLAQIKLSPTSALRALGLDPDEVVRTALMEKIGDKATPEMKEMLERTQTKRELAQLRAQIQEAERARAAQAYFDRVAAGAQDHVRNLEGLSKHAPTVAHVAKSDPGRVFQEIMEEIQKDAQTRSRTEPNGDVIGYEEAAKRVESRWGALKSMLGASVTPEIPSNASMSATKTVEAAVQKPNPPNTVKPPERPLAPWLQSSKTEDEGLRAAIDEWRRAESARK